MLDREQGIVRRLGEEAGRRGRGNELVDGPAVLRTTRMLPGIVPVAGWRRRSWSPAVGGL
ncbi:hypothetical protein SAMN07250955_101392 [Arboricoccus pini]|uniref:Uncharacterized protein n=1 Tax=Arboricoccus pini TaxID=1963835 RepID=A0A212Q328_9PROT|nr:hypothetical protein SAMN07250955_101392 [Arboricoccus pini]